MQDLNDLITCLEAKQIELNAQKDLFIKAKGLDEQAVKLRAEVETIHVNITEEKEKRASLVDKKNKALMSVMSRVEASMNEILPYGFARAQIEEDGSVFIGWNTGKAIVPYSGLSGGEKATFDPALCKALGGNILIVEAAEIDSKHLSEAFAKYEVSGMQVIVSTCHIPQLPLNWQVVKL